MKRLLYVSLSSVVMTAMFGVGVVNSASATAITSIPRLTSGSTLRVGEELVSPSGVYSARLESGGQLSIERAGHAVWTVGADSGLDHVVTTKADGAISVKSSRAKNSPSSLALTNSGELTVSTANGTPVWQDGVEAHLTSSSSIPPYSAGNLFGDTNPSLTCFTCQAANITGTAPPSNTLDSGTDVDALTGDFFTENDLFDAPAIGSDLSFPLYYDAQMAQYQLGSGLTTPPPGGLGWGWGTTLSASITPQSGDTPTSSVTIDQGDGSEVSFSQSLDYGTSTSCQPVNESTDGDYPTTNKYTLSGSDLQWCAAASVQGQLADDDGTSFTYQSENGQLLQDFAWTGTLSSSSSLAGESGSSPGQVTLLYNVAGGSTAKTASNVTLPEQCPSSAAHCTIAYSSDARDLVEEFNSAGLVTTVIDPAGNVYSLSHDSSGDLTSVSVPGPNTASPSTTPSSTWNYVYGSGAASPFSSDLTKIEDPDYNSSVSTYAHTTTITYGTVTGASGDDGMVTSLVDGMGTSGTAGATTTYAYTAQCSADPPPDEPSSYYQCMGSGDAQTTTITYPAQPTGSGTSAAPIETDQYMAGLETSSELGAGSGAPLDNETWNYAWNFGNGVANTSEVITYPDTLNVAQSSSYVAPTATIITDPAGNIVSTTDADGNVQTSAYNDVGANDLNELLWSYPGSSTNSASSPPAGASVYTYNANGQVLTSTDALGNTTSYGYYANNGLLCFEVPPTVNGVVSAPAPTSCTSSGSGTDQGAVGAPTGATTFSYDAQGDIISSTLDANDSSSAAAPQTTTADYDVMGNVLWSIPAPGQSGSQSSSNPYATVATYSAADLPMTVTYPSQSTIDFTYDAAFNLTLKAQAVPAASTYYAYDGDNRVCYQQTREYPSTTSTCSTGNLAGSSAYTYVPGSTALATSIDSNGDPTTYYYADLAYPDSPTEVLGSSTYVQYSAFDDLGDTCVTGDVDPVSDGVITDTQCNALSGDTSTTYDPLHNALSVTDPSGNTTTNTYANSAFPTLETSTANETGETTHYAYDADGRLVTTTNPDGTAVSEAYNANGEVCSKEPTALVYPCGEGPSLAGVSEYGYDDAGERTSMSDDTADPAYPERWSVPTTYTYTNGELTSTTNGNGQTVSYLYNDAGQVACTAYPVSTTASCGTLSSPGTPSSTNTIVDDTYDSAGRLASVSDWLGHTTTYGYGDWTPNTPSTITYPSSTGLVACYGDDNDGNVTSLSVGSSCSSTTGPINDTWSYDGDERVAVSTLNGTAGGWTTYTGDNQIEYGTNMPTTTPGEDDAYGLAPNGEIDWAWRDAGTTETFGYNSDDELCWSVPTSESSNTCTPPSSSSVPVTTYGYNANGERTSTTTTAGSTAGTITAVGSINSSTSTGLSTLSVDPLSAGDLIALFVEVGGTPTVTGVSGGGATWQKVRSVNDGVDADLWIGTVNAVGDSTITVSYSASVASDWVELSSQEFTYGTGAATTWHIDTTGEADNNWGSSSTLDYPSLTPSGSHELYIGGSFDESAAGTGSTSGVVYQPTWDLNQMVYDTNVSATLAPTAPDSPAGGYFNVAGLISVSGTVPATTTTNYDWNSYGQLCNVSTSGVTACGTQPTSGTSYTYNGDGLRMTASTGSSTTSTAWDTVGSDPLDLDDATTTSGSTTNVSYIYGDLLSGGTAPIEQITTTSSGSTAVFLTSNQTGVQGVFSVTGSTLELADYSLYGQQTVTSGSDVTPFGYQGSYTDPTGLIYLVNRYYDPLTDEFLSVDPDVTMTDQPYVFTNDDPLNLEDPLGLCIRTPSGGCVPAPAPKPSPAPKPKPKPTPQPKPGSTSNSGGGSQSTSSSYSSPTTTTQAVNDYIAAENLYQFDESINAANANTKINGACALFMGWGGVMVTSGGAETFGVGAMGMRSAFAGEEFAPETFGASLVLTVFGAATAYGGTVAMLNAMGDGSACKEP